MATISNATDNNFLRWFKVKGDLTLDELQSGGLPAGGEPPTDPDPPGLPGDPGGQLILSNGDNVGLNPSPDTLILSDT